MSAYKNHLGYKKKKKFIYLAPVILIQNNWRKTQELEFLTALQIILVYGIWEH